MANLIDYGLVVNIFGNYKEEGATLGRTVDNLNQNLKGLQRMVIGGGIGYGMYKIGQQFLRTALVMENSFAGLRSSMGSTVKAMETLDWARRKSMDSPYSSGEIAGMANSMSLMGLSQTKEMRDQVYAAIGNFAGMQGADLNSTMMAVARATQGQWGYLQRQMGLSQSTVGARVQERVAQKPEQFSGQIASIERSIKLVQTGKAGTEAYKAAVIELIGVLGEGGMEERLNTISGAWGSMLNMVNEVKQNIVGYSQVEGTLANAIKNSIVNNIIEPFTTAREVTVNGAKEMTTSMEQLGRIGKGVGQIFTGIWGIVDSQIAASSKGIMGWIDRLGAFFRDYKENVAPIILFIALIKIQTEEFLSSFYKGFKQTFLWFLDMGVQVWKNMARLAEGLGLISENGNTLGRVLGWVIGLFVGISAYRIMVSPFTPLINGASMLGRTLLTVLFRQAALVKAMNPEFWVNQSLLQRMVLTFKSIGWAIQGAAISAWNFSAALLANPITWVVVAVVALVGWLVYLARNWDDVRASMQGVSDATLFFMSVIAPVIGIPLLMAKHWTKFEKIFKNVWRSISAVVELVKLPFIDFFDTITGGATKLWNIFSEKFPRIASILEKAFAPIVLLFNLAKDFVGSGLEKVLDYFVKMTGDDANKLEAIANERRALMVQEKNKEATNEEWNDNRVSKYASGIRPTSYVTPQGANDNSVTIGEVTINTQPGDDGKDMYNKWLYVVSSEAEKKGK